jgi:hypothetical protein
MKPTFRIWRLILTIAAVLAAPTSGLACTCMAYPTFDELAKDAANLWVVRVGGQGVPITADAYGDPVAYIDVEVVRVVKGGSAPTRLRIWDAFFRADCSSGLSPLKAGTLAALIVRQAKTAENEEFWSFFTERPSVGSYFVDGGCTEPWKRLKSEREAEKYRKR